MEYIITSMINRIRMVYNIYIHLGPGWGMKSRAMEQNISDRFTWSVHLYVVTKKMWHTNTLSNNEQL